MKITVYLDPYILPCPKELRPKKEDYEHFMDLIRSIAKGEGWQAICFLEEEDE